MRFARVLFILFNKVLIVGAITMQRTPPESHPSPVCFSNLFN